MTVLVGFVPTPEGEAALRAGLQEARTRGESLLVLNTSRGDSYVDRGFAEPKDIDRLRRDLADLGIASEVRQTVGGRDAAEEIVEVAASPEISLVVIGLRKRSAVGKFVLGSSAQRILLDSPCPVLAVKADS
ncbi:universal stress protein [Kitasatospora sp. NPDC058406]|uniref:universal stress protein n=1 Tax=Kitasatospora sp. NPDC058406 TaxID=3346483 RepID=UPI00365AEA96